MPFRNENEIVGLLPNARYQQGKTNIDNEGVVEDGVTLPWNDDYEASYLYYDCTVIAVLDSGIAVHNRLPQINRTTDVLSSVFLDDVNLSIVADRGVNLKSNDQYEDIVQRMSHSRYWFNIRGRAIRAGYQVPIPAIKYIGGAPAIPHDDNPQWAYNKMAPSANFGGVIVWYAQWSLWYTTAVPPTTNYIPAANPSSHVNNTIPPKDIQVPYGPLDNNTILGGTSPVPNTPSILNGARNQ